MKKFLLALCLLMGYATLHADTAIVNGITWSYQVSNGKAEIYGISSSASGKLTIPEKLDGYPVTSIGISAFYGRDRLTSVTIPKGVTSIGDQAFFNCTSLTSVTIPEGVKTIGTSAFAACWRLTSVTIPEGVTSIEDATFSGCTDLTSVTIPSSVTSIGEYAFRDCWGLWEDANGVQYESDAKVVLIKAPTSLAGELVIPNTVRFIHSEAFSDCSSLRSVTIPEGVTSIRDDAFYGCSSLTSITIPEGVTSIGGSAFSWCTSLTSVTIPSSVTTIGDYAFSGCSNLTSVTIPEGVTSIRVWAFYGCSSLTSVTIPEGVTTIGYDAFSGCSSLTSVTIPSSVTSIGGNAFRGVAPTTLTAALLPSGMSEDNLTTLIIPEGVTSIGSFAFYNCSSLTSVTIPASVTSIVSNAFGSRVAPTTLTAAWLPSGMSKGNLKTLIIPEGTTTIPDSAFYDCSSLTSVTIPEGVTSIGSSAFSGCSNLPKDENGVQYESDARVILIKAPTSLAGNFVIPNTVRFIHSSAFEGCSGLTSVTIPASVTSIGSNAFSGVAPTTLTAAWLPSGMSKDNLKTLIIPEGVTSIGSSAFSACSSLTSVTIPSSVTSIGEGAFSGVAPTTLTAAWLPSGMSKDNLTTLIIPEGVTSIGNSAFRDCSGLTSVMIPASVTSIGSNAFSGVAPTTLTAAWLPSGMSKGNLKTLIIPEGVTSIRNSAFASCYYLTSVTIPSSVTTIGYQAFEGCTRLISFIVDDDSQNYSVIEGLLCSKDGKTLVACPGGLTAVTIPSSVTSIGDNAFYGCTSLTSVTIPSSVTSIGSSAFSGCSSLTSVTIPSSVTSIGSSAFSGCARLTSVTIPSSVTTIGSSAFSGCSGLTAVTIPSSVISIGAQAFRGVAPQVLTSPFVASAGGMSTANLKEITYLEGLTSITEKFFKSNTTLKSIAIPSTVKEIGASAFQDCSALEVVTIAEGLEKIGSEAFKHCSNVAQFTLPASLMEIGDCAFTGCQLVEVAQGNANYESVDGILFTKAKTLDGIHGDDNVWLLHFPVNRGGVYIVPKHVHTIGDEAFAENEQIEDVTLPAVTVIRPAAFMGCSALKYCFAMDGLLRVQAEAFAEATSLTTFTMPASVERLESAAFRNCSSLAIVAFKGAPPVIDTVSGVGTTLVFTGTDYDHQVGGTYSSAHAAAWRAAFGNNGMWDGLRMIPAENYISYDCDNNFNYTVYDGEVTITGTTHELSGNVVIPRYLSGCLVTEIEAMALDNCYQATSFTLPVGIKLLPSDVFINCSSLAAFHVAPENVVFASRDGVLFDDTITTLVSVPQTMASVNIPESVKKISAYAFAYCESLSAVYLPSALTTVETGVFEGCKSSLRVIFGGGVPTTVADDAFDALDGYYLSQFSRVWSRVIENGKWKNLRMHELAKTKLTFVFGYGSNLVLEFAPGITLTPPQIPTREGYTFKGWSPALPATVPTKDTTYTAQWQINQYTLTFDANGGRGGKTLKQNYGTKVTVPTVTRPGYTFIGWSPAVPATVPAMNVTYVAQWQANDLGGDTPGVELYTITFNANGGTGGKTVKQAAGTTLTAPTVMRTGYTFVGWLPAVPAKTPAQNVTYTAQWKVNSTTGDDTSATVDIALLTYTEKNGQVTITGCEVDAISGVLEIPETLYGYTVVAIGNGAFAGQKLEKVILPNTITSIGKDAFKNCSTLDVNAVVMPNQAKLKVGKGAFTGCMAEAIDLRPGAVFTIDGLTGYKLNTTASGVKLNAKTGILTATFTKPGEFEVVLSKPGEELKAISFTVGAFPTLLLSMDGGDAKCKVAGAGAYLVGKKITLKATASKGYVFAGWYKDADFDCPCDSTLVDYRNPNYTYTMGEADVMMYARFVTTEEDELLTLTVQNKADDATVDPFVIDGDAEFALIVKSNSLPKVTVKGLPTGMKFTAKPVMVKGSKTEVEYPANTIYGTPTKPGVYTVTVSLTNSTIKKAVMTTFKIEVPNLRAPGVIDILDLYGPYIVGGADIETIGNAEGCTVTGLPPGMKWTAKALYKKGSKTEIETPANSVYGVPTKPGNYTVYFKKTVNKVKYTATATFKVEPEGVQLEMADENWADQEFVKGTGLSELCLTTSATSSVKSVKATKLPPGLKVVNDGGVWKIIGTPTTPGTYMVTLTLTTAFGSTMTLPIQMEVRLLPSWATGTFSGAIENQYWEWDDYWEEDYLAYIGGTATIEVNDKGWVNGSLYFWDGASGEIDAQATVIAQKDGTYLLKVKSKWYDEDGVYDGSSTSYMTIDGSEELFYDDGDDYEYVRGTLTK